MISVVIPAYNEEGAISATIKELDSALAAAGVQGAEIVVVDDGSSDKTFEAARNAGARVIRHPHNVGYGRSLKDGVAAAGFDTVVITDADGTYQPVAVRQLLDRYAEGFDMVVGARHGAHYRESLFKMPLRWILRKLVEFTAGRSVPDINSGMRVFSRKTILNYHERLCDTFSFTTSLTLAYMMTGRFVAYVPIGYNKRIGRSKVRLVRDTLFTLQYVLEAAIFYNPLRIFLLAGLGLGATGALSLAAALATQLNVFYFLGIGSILVALVTLGMGLLAAQLKQIMESPIKQQSSVDEETAAQEAVTSVHRPYAESPLRKISA